MSNLVLGADLDFEPGTGYPYSNGGYFLLAVIIEQVSGTSYLQFLKDNIFKPLSMKDTGHNKGNEVIRNLSTGYDPSGYRDVKITDFLDSELLKGSGSLYSTT